MPLFSSQLQLNTAASASGTPLADVSAIKGAFKVYPTYLGMIDVPVSLISDKQIVWVEDAASLYQATITPADYITTFEDTVTWAEFTGFGGGGASSGDITAVLAGNGLTGGAFTGTATLNVGQGNGITVTTDAISAKAGDGVSVDSGGINIDTGSAHFTGGVQQTEIDGGSI
jgi:hypothetical protein